MRGRALGILGLLLLGLAVGGPAAAWDDRIPPPYDPTLGIDPSGRVPKVPLPADLAAPSRWRYIPEGRLKPGAPWERFLVSTFAAPQFFFEEDVGVGAGLSLTDIDFRAQRRREFFGAFFTYTTEGQQRYRAIWRRWLHHRDLVTGGVVLEERSHLDGAGGYEKTLTRRFYGLGPDTRENDETSYTDEAIDLRLNGQFALPGPGGDWIANVSVRGEHHDLSRGRVSGVPSTDRAFPGLFAASDPRDALWLTAGLRYDTRDSQHQPYAGWRAGLVADVAPWQTGGAAGALLSAYADVSVRVPPLFHRGGEGEEENPPTDTLAFAAFVTTSTGELAFYDRPSLGGPSTLRGYIANRFTGDAAWHASGEYRIWVISRGFRLSRTIRIERIGLALFGDVGTVADALDELARARIHASYGLGLRVSLERIALFRLDVGFSTEGVNFTAGFGLPF